uniref:Nucleotid_trans domain-containing protein n=2 Tax=Caenorhabditis japonica TaxID=281687 RepID=A0A8R1DQ63_CAEJA
MGQQTIFSSMRKLSRHSVPVIIVLVIFGVEVVFKHRYDSSNVDVVLNHICNLKFIPNALSRLVAVAFDENALNVLQKKHPTVPNVLVNLEQYTRTIDSDMENRRYLIYSFALVTHAKICASLAARGIDFWSMHQVCA